MHHLALLLIDVGVAFLLIAVLGRSLARSVTTGGAGDVVSSAG